MHNPFRRPRRLGRPLVTALVATAVPLALLFSSSSASGVPTTDSPAQSGSAARVKPTIVLVHGGWADSSGWNGEISRLQKDGYAVLAPANPLRGLSSDAAYLRSVLQSIDGPIVLVGHSYGGAVISNAAVGVSTVRALVYIAAFAPDTGESLAQLVTMNPGTHITPDALDNRLYPLPDGTTGTDLYIKASVFRDAFAADLPVGTTRLMQATQRPFSVAAFTEPSGPPAWKTIPSWYLVATDDHAIPPATERFMAQRAGAYTTEVAASHVPMMSQPSVTTDLIVRAARAVG